LPVLGAVGQWGLRLSAACALAAAGYLAWASLTRGSMVGCQGLPHFDCQDVLSSRWAYWLTIPVSLAGAAVYAALFSAACCIGPRRAPRLRRSAWIVLVLAAMLAAAAACWFVALMLLAGEKLCLWCLVAHASALGAAGFALAALLRAAAPPCFTPRVLLKLSGAAAAAMAVLIVGQVFGPRPLTYRVEALPDEAASEQPPEGSPAGGPDAGKAVAPATGPESPGGEEGPLRPGTNRLSPQDRPRLPRTGSAADCRAFPCLGPPGAQHVVVEMLDYSCKHCRLVHQHLQAARRRYGPQFLVVAIPVPLNTDCNEYVVQTLPDATDACQYARLAVAVWRLNPAKFPAFHDWLFEPDRPPSPGEATWYAAELVGRPALERELAGAELEQTLRGYRDLFHRLGEGALPKLVLGNYVVSGEIEDSSELFDMLEKYLSLRPAAATAGR
jgi:uncharacterized membrane protein